jgi:type III secretion apparatus YscR/HrcR family protein
MLGTAREWLLRLQTKPAYALALAGAVAVVLYVALDRPLYALVALVAVYVGGARLRSRAAARIDDSVPVRLGGCALGQSSSIHAVRFDNRVFLVGATPARVTVLAENAGSGAPTDTPPDQFEQPAHRRESARPRWVATILLAVAVLPLASASAAIQNESNEQRVEFGTAGAKRPRDREAAVPPTTPPALSFAPSSPSPHIAPESQPGGSIVWIAVLALAPFAVLGATSFVKISVVLSFLRSALGTPQTPSDPVLAAIALSVTFFVMSPTIAEAVDRARERGADVSTAGGALAVVADAVEPFRAFLARNSRPEEVALFVELSSRDGRETAAPGDLAVLLPAFVTSQLREAFVAGFLLYVPFLVVDMVVANVLMSMGMVMVSPTMVSLPLKVLLFVLADGWPLLLKALALGYQ